MDAEEATAWPLRRFVRAFYFAIDPIAKPKKASDGSLAVCSSNFLSCCLQQVLFLTHKFFALLTRSFDFCSIFHSCAMCSPCKK
jgi:hypothetical protein